MRILNVRKTLTTEAIQITDAESEALVRGWLKEARFSEHDDLSELIEAQVYFMRDEKNPIVYITPEADFIHNWEEIEPAKTKEDPIEEATQELFDASLRNILKAIE